MPRRGVSRYPTSSKTSFVLNSSVSGRWDQSGADREVEATGILAICIQHEMDHLDGKLFVDRLSELKRTRIRKKFDKIQRRTG